MAVSIVVHNALQHLQNYYKRLYFLRIFFPTKLKRNFAALEKMDLSSESDANIANLVNNFYLSLRAPNWYAKLFLYFFSTVYQFAHGYLMLQITALDESRLANEDNLILMLGYSNLENGLKGVQLLRQTGIDIRNLETKKAVVANILKVSECHLLSVMSEAFYKKIAETQGKIEFSEGIKILQRNALSVICIKFLISSIRPSSLASALYRLSEHKILPSTNELLTGENTLKTIILTEIQKVTQPGLLADGVLLLNQHKKLTEANFRTLLTSAQPDALAQLMIDFEKDLTDTLLPKLEDHRLNLTRIATQRILSAKQKKDISYCQNLNTWMNETGTIISPDLFVFYDEKESLFNEERLGFARVMTLLNIEQIWNSPILPLYKGFLDLGMQKDQFFVYAELLAIFAKQADLLNTEEQTNALFEAVNTCVNVNELLRRCQCSRNGEQTMSLRYVQAIAMHIKNSHVVVSKPKTSSTGLRRRFAPIASGVDIEHVENGKDDEDKPKTMPPKTAQVSSSIFGMIGTGIVNAVKLTGIWTNEVVQEQNNNCESNDSSSVINTAFANFV